MNKQLMVVIGGMAGGLVLVGWAGWQFVLRPAAAAITALEADRDAASEKLNDTKAKAMQYEKFQAEAENIRRDLVFVSQRLNPDFPEAEYVRLVQGLVSAENPRDWSVTFKPPKEGNRAKTKASGLDLDEREFSVKFRGDYENLGRLLNTAVQQTRMVSPEKVVIKPVNDDEGRQTIEATVDMKVFTQPEEKGPPK